MYNHDHSKLHDEWKLLVTDIILCHTCGYQLSSSVHFCSSWDCRKRCHDLFELSDSEENLIRKYFKYGHDCQTICLVFEKFYGIEISLRTLKRPLAQNVLENARKQALTYQMKHYVQ